MAKKAKKDYTAWVKLDALLGFTVSAESPEDALSRAREELKTLRLVDEDVEYMDGTETITGVTER